MGGGSEAATLASASPERLTGGPVGASIPPPTPEGLVLTCRSELSRPLSPSLVEMSKDERLAWGVCLTERTT